MRSFVPFILLFSLASTVHAGGATFGYHVAVSIRGHMIIDQDATADLGRVAKVERTKAFELQGAGCATLGTSQASVPGVGKSGVTVEIAPVATNTTATVARTVVHLFDSEFVRAIDTSAGACHGQTPAMIKYDSSATFNLAAGKTGTLQVGDYTVAVRLERSRISQTAGIAL